MPRASFFLVVLSLTAAVAGCSERSLVPGAELAAPVTSLASRDAGNAAGKQQNGSNDDSADEGKRALTFAVLRDQLLLECAHRIASPRGLRPCEPRDASQHKHETA